MPQLSNSARIGLLSAMLLAAMGSIPAAEAAPQSLLVVDANTGATLIGQDADEPRSPASLAKMMTLYLTFEALERGSLTMRTPIRASERAAAASPSKLDLDVGETIALEDAILALVTKSANDVAIAIAEHLAGSEDAFARAMTDKCRQLGMTATTFKNASGLPDPGQTTTARDMVTLGLRLHDNFPKYFRLFSTRSFVHDGKTYRNHNTLMLHMAGVSGIKTGYTRASGFNLVTSYESEGRHLMAAVFGGETAARRNATMRLALTKSIGRASTAKTRRPLMLAAVRAKKVAVSAPVPQLASRRPKPPELTATSAEVAPPPSQSRDERTPNSVIVQAAAPPPVAPVLGPNVQIAKVRAVDVAPLVAASEPGTPGTRVADTRVVSLERREDRPPPAPSIALRSGTSDPARSAPPAPAFQGSGGSPPVLGRSPSSLGAQHLALAGVSAPRQAAPAYRLDGPSTPVRATAAPPPIPPGPPAQALSERATWEIQVGAVATPEEAQRLLSAVQAKAGQILAGKAPIQRTVVAGGRTLQRARFQGFDQTSASATCGELARRQVSCIVFKVE